MTPILLDTRAEAGRLSVDHRSPVHFWYFDIGCAHMVEKPEVRVCRAWRDHGHDHSLGPAGGCPPSA